MLSFRAVLLGALASATVSIAQFVEAPTDLIKKTGGAGINVRYKEVPHGICELTLGVKSYSGYADVAEGEHIFFWFFEAREVDPTEAPLTIWINGGPGSSSMIGLFQELGPCTIDQQGNVVHNPYAWNNNSNTIFIDQPTMTGLSYSDPVRAYADPSTGEIVPLKKNEQTCPKGAADSCGTWSFPDESKTANSTDAAAPNFWRTLQGFLGAFPQYSHSKVSFATESYGGHYAPVFSDYIVKQNEKKVPNAVKINLDSVLIGNGWFDPKIQYPTYFDFAIEKNTYVTPLIENKKAIKDWRYKAYGKGQCEDQVAKCYETGTNKDCIKADNFCYTAVEAFFDRKTHRDEYDMRELTPDPFPPIWYVDYLNTPRVQKAIGAFTNYSESSPTVGSAYATTGDDARDPNTVEHIRNLLNHNVQTVLYIGDADYICNWYGVFEYAKRIKAPGYAEAGFAPMKTPDGIEHADVKQAGLFSFVRIYESGHEVPFYQPLASLVLLNRALHRKDLATGTWSMDQYPWYTTSGPPTTTYREGNETMQYRVWPKSATYNTTTNEPNPPKGGNGDEDGPTEAKKRGLALFRSRHLQE